MRTRSLSVFAAVLACALFPGDHARAASVMLDDFSIDQAPVQDFTVDGSPVVGVLGSVRTLRSDLLASNGPVSNSVQVGFGLLEVDNGAGEDSEVTASYSLTADLVPAQATNIVFFYRVAQSDANAASLRFLLNGTDLSPTHSATFIPGNTSDLELTFSPNQVHMGAGDRIDVVMNGAPGWDLSMDYIGVRYDVAAVPEPSTLATLGMGVLIIAGLVRRRRG